MNICNDIRKKFTVAVIGLGNIGMGYDVGHISSDFVLTHVRAFIEQAEFQLVAAVDSNPKLRKIFTKLTDLPAFESIEQLIKFYKVDIVVVATPTNTHYKILQNILCLMKPLAILCEKPLTGNLNDCVDIVESCQNKGVPLYVNYIRRADPGVKEVKSRIEKGLICSPFKAVIWYTKGMIHNGSHFLDLFYFWFGKIKSARLLKSGRKIGHEDAEPDFSIEFENGSAFFYAVASENFAHYTADIILQNGRLQYEIENKIFWSQIMPDGLLSSGRKLESPAQIIVSDMSHYQLNVANELAKALNGFPHSLCTGQDAVEIMIALNEILNLNKQMGNIHE
jgi:predicted dehydrogenase